MARVSAKNNRHSRRKVSRHASNAKFKKGFPVAAVRALWDASKSARENYAKIGISLGKNDEASMLSHKSRRIDPVAPAVFYDLVDGKPVLPPEVLVEPSAKVEHHMKPGEVAYLQNLIRKHAPAAAALGFSGAVCASAAVAIPEAAYTAMFRDLKLNYMQHTAQHLATRIARMYRFLVAKEARERERGAAGGAGDAGAGAAGSSAGSGMPEEEEEEEEDGEDGSSEGDTSSGSEDEEEEEEEKATGSGSRKGAGAQAASKGTGAAKAGGAGKPAAKGAGGSAAAAPAAAAKAAQAAAKAAVKEKGGAAAGGGKKR